VRWVPLGDLWSFWRGGKLTKQAIFKALSTAYELYLFDARWFLDVLSYKGGALKGTDVLADGLTKDELTQWIHRIHETGDGTPKGFVAALGWDRIVAKTPNEVLVGVLDAMVTKVGLVPATAKESGPRLPEAGAKTEPKAEPPPAPPAATPAPSPAEHVTAKPMAMTDVPPPVEGSWSAVPPPPDPPGSAPADDGINVVVDEEVVVVDRAGPPTAPRMRSAAPVDDDNTEVRPVPRRSDRPSGSRGPTRR
jgi:pyruvate dehydrogenase E2 component (dihydrolipoamide acetyltransferase)